MSSPPAWVIEIETLARGLPVLLVEGEEDETWLGHFLDAHAWDWRSRLYVALADGKRRVIQAVTGHRPAWIGIVDRDDWREADIQAAANRSDHLHILPRFCVESYLSQRSQRALDRSPPTAARQGWWGRRHQKTVVRRQ